MHTAEERQVLGTHEGRIAPEDRLRALGAASGPQRAMVGSLLDIAKSALPRMQQGNSFVHTLRRTSVPDGWTTRAHGDNSRYATTVALGISCLLPEEQRAILGGLTAADLARSGAARAEISDDPGTVALAAWAMAEVNGEYHEQLLARLEQLLASGKPVATDHCAWILLAATSARQFGDTEKLGAMAKAKLLQEQRASGLFPHRLPASYNSRVRAHVACFADQAYPILALARLATAADDTEALMAAESCAAAIVAMQGHGGQWWWHYDIRNGSVIEGYPVYSVHQYGIAPMALLALREAGGADYMPELVNGLRWLARPPEIRKATLIDAEHQLIWRKVARREPMKLVRAISAASALAYAGFKPPGLNALFPPIRIDYECRPYELGWLLYAWLGGSKADEKTFIAKASNIGSAT